jgi:selenocysteine lyase/cysteine desulfurase
LPPPLRERLADVPGVAVHDQGAQRCAIVTFSKQGVTARDIAARLRARASTRRPRPWSRRRFDFEARGLTEMVRVPPHYYSTLDELDRLCGAVESMRWTQRSSQVRGNPVGGND